MRPHGAHDAFRQILGARTKTNKQEGVSVVTAPAGPKVPPSSWRPRGLGLPATPNAVLALEALWLVRARLRPHAPDAPSVTETWKIKHGRGQVGRSRSARMVRPQKTQRGAVAAQCVENESIRTRTCAGGKIMATERKLAWRIQSGIAGCWTDESRNKNTRGRGFSTALMGRVFILFYH